MMDYQLRPSVVEDRDGLAPVLQRAFTQFNISVGIPPEVDLETAESATHLLDEVLVFPSYGITAVDKDSGLPIGAAFLNFQGELVQRIGPLFVDPYRSNRGVGKALMNALIDKAKATNAISIRLLQITTNTKSFSLYAKLGFRPVECISYFEGTLNENVNTQATGLTGYKIRRMEESDVHLCSELHRKVMGHERESDIRGKQLQMNLGNAWVLMKDDILQYAYQEPLLVSLINDIVFKLISVALYSREEV